MGKAVVTAKLTDFKKCICCGSIKPSGDFGVDKRATDRRKSECKTCRNTAEKKRRENLTREQKDAHNERVKKYYRTSQRSRAIHLVNSARNRKNPVCEITVDYIDTIIQSYGRCAMSGIKFHFTDGEQRRQTPFSPSLDRKDNNEGYSFSNTQVVCTMYNIGKAHHNETDFIAFCMAVAERNKENHEALRRMRELVT